MVRGVDNFNLIEAVKSMPPMLAGEELVSALTVLPEYDERICKESKAVRLMALSNLYSVYLPSPMSLEIYSKLYLSLLRSLQKKNTTAAVRQRYENNKSIRQQAYSGIIGGSDSYTIIGASGIGKSSAISRAVSLIAHKRLIETEHPYSRIIPCLTVQCPFDSSVKGLLLEILRKADEELGTRYYEHALKSRAATVDMLIGVVSTVALNHIGLLIVDEIQNVANSKNGKSLVGMLTQLINNSGISICMVGTPESTVFFEQAMQLARRSLGLQYGRLECNQYFHDFCCALFRYQYVKQRSDVTPAIIEWLYEHSAGVIAVVVSLVHDAQEIAILNDIEELNMEVLNEAYQKRLVLLHSYIEPSIKRKAQCNPNPKTTSSMQAQNKDVHNEKSLQELAAIAKNDHIDIVKLLRQQGITVEEVAV